MEENNNEEEFSPEQLDTNLLSEDGRSKTIDSSLKLVALAAGDSPDDWRYKGLGLQLSLLGLAEIQSLRMSRLAGHVYRLEQEVFKDKNLRELDPRKLIDLYTMATRALSDSSEYIRSTIGSVDWKEIETQLLALSAKKGVESITAGEAELGRVADTLLHQVMNLARLQQPDSQGAIEPGAGSSGKEG